MRFFFVLFYFFVVTITAQVPNTPYQFPKIKSSVTLPVRIPLAEVSRLANASVKELIYEDSSFEDHNNDHFKVKVWKLKPIRIVGGKNQNLIIEVPLKIWAQKGVGTLGVYSYQETNFETVMYFNMQLQFQNDWKILTNTKPNGFKWLSKPTLNFGAIKIPITSLVEKSLQEQQADFCKTMDQKMAEVLNLQSIMLLAWNQFTQPFLVSEEYNTWLKITPLIINMLSPKFYADEIQTTLSFEVFSETFTGAKPNAGQPLKKIPDVQFVSELKPNFNLQTTANIPFTQATAIAKQIFIGKEFDFREGKSKVKVNDIFVRSDGQRIQLEILTDGAINGTSYVSGIPYYDAETKRIALRDSKFKLKTKNILHKTATLLFQKKIVDMIEKQYGIPTLDLENEAKKGFENALNTEYYKGLKLNGVVKRLYISQLLLNQDFITAVLDTEAQMMMKINGLLINN